MATETEERLGGPQCDPFGYRKILRRQLLTLRYQGHGEAFVPPCEDFVSVRHQHYYIHRHEENPDGPYYAATSGHRDEFGLWAAGEHESLESTPHPTVEGCIRAAEAILTAVAGRVYADPARFSFLASESREV